MTWRKERSERLDELLHAHQSVGGPSRGRRWRRDLDGLTANLDGEIAAQLGRLFQRQSPW